MRSGLNVYGDLSGGTPYQIAENGGTTAPPHTVTWKPNYPKTVPVTGAAAAALACMPGCWRPGEIRAQPK
jgi:hypothetical protein